MRNGKPCYLYGVVRAADADRVPVVPGVAGGTLTTVSSGELAAVVSKLDDLELSANRADILAHAEVLQAIVERCDVLPVRFGYIYVSEEQVRRDLLEREAGSLLQILGDLDDAVEMQVKASYIEEAVVAELVRSDRRLQKLRAARQDHGTQLELGRRFASVLESRRQADAARIVDRTRRMASRTSTGTPRGDFGVVDAAFLVPRGGVPAFLEAVERIAAETPSLTIRTLGPMAPYSFVDGTVRGAA